MEAGIIGLPGVGKTTLLGSLAGLDPASLHGGGRRPNVAVAAIPDPRLAQIEAHLETGRIVEATLRLVDLPGLQEGETKALNACLAPAREVDALCHVVRCWRGGELDAPDPGRDVDTLDTELVLADLAVAEGIVDGARRAARAGDAEAAQRASLLDRIIPSLEEGRPIRSMESWSEADRAWLRSWGMITAKPVLHVANIDESDLGSACPAANAVDALSRKRGGGCVRLSAKLEAEITQLDAEDRGPMLASIGLDEPAVGPLARALLGVLGCMTFYTTGPEVRAWVISVGATASEAAGVIHGDIERGFIRAECYHVDDLAEHGSEKAVKAAGRLRTEGKQYRVQDGDVVHFLFNV